MSRTSPLSRMGTLASLCALAASGPAASQTFITFKVLYDNLNTYAYAVNASGAVTGDAAGDDFSDGYVRTADGKVTTFTPSLNTFSLAINRKGATTGFYEDDNENFENHGFLRTPDGQIISFDPTGSTDTEPSAINDSGVITGLYDTHGFLRAANGAITTFDPNGSTGAHPPPSTPTAMSLDITTTRQAMRMASCAWPMEQSPVSTSRT